MITRFISWGRSLNRAAAFDALQKVLAGIGLGTCFANFAVMRLWLLAPALALFAVAWYGLYRQYGA
jgi:hypothetical protein